MKKQFVLLSIVVSLLLVSCGGGSSSSTASCDQDYWDGEIGTCLPSGWDILDRETLRQRGVPEETIVAFQSQESVSGQFPIVAITREQLANPVGSDEYSDANIRLISAFEGYEHIDTKDTDVAGQSVSMHMYSAQPIESEPRRRFYQVSLTNGDVGYTVTAAAPISLDGSFEKKMLLMIEQLTFEERKEEE